jgi:pyrroline-5-carboxylate reductase
MAGELQNFAGGLLLVGCGNMAGAMLTRWMKAGLPASSVTIVDPTPSAVPEGAAHFADLDAMTAARAAAPAWILLGIKPQQLNDVAGALAPLAGAETRLVSMLAGVTLADLGARFQDAGAHVRILPNLPARIGAGVTAVAATGTSKADDKAIAALLTPLGRVLTLADDSQMDLITAFTGSGPAFILRLIEAYAGAGERLGLTPEEALGLAAATFGGATAWLEDSGETPAGLVAQVTSKGGTTQAGLDVLDSDGRLVALMTEVLRAARDRGRELADIARGPD